jgi:hypothetical protein
MQFSGAGLLRVGRLLLRMWSVPLTRHDNGADRSPRRTALIAFAIGLAIFLTIAAVFDRIGLWPPELAYDDCHGFFEI